MSGKNARQIRKALNEAERKVRVDRQKVANEVLLELINSPFKYRFLFAMKLIFRRKK